MQAVRWKERFATEIRQIDVANESLIYLLRHLFEQGVECGSQPCNGRSASCRKVDMLISFLSRNLAIEEALMARFGYPDRLAHTKDHGTIVNRLREWRDLPVCHSPHRERLQVLIVDWALRHITTLDKRFGLWTRRQGPVVDSDYAARAEQPLACLKGRPGFTCGSSHRR
jgi:hemerythrin-like metal-binding protein